MSFELVQQLIVDGPEQCVSVDNIPGLVAVLDDFATAAGIVVQAEQQHTRRHPKLDSTRSALRASGAHMHSLLTARGLPTARLSSTADARPWTSCLRL